jgi:hypothetical protein
MMGRAAHKARYRQWDKTVVDRLEGKYDTKTRKLESGFEKDKVQNAGSGSDVENEKSNKS